MIITIVIIIKDANYNVAGMKRYALQTLTAVTLSNGTTAITDWMFTGCPITSIIIPSTITSIGILLF